jgi:titin
MTLFLAPGPGFASTFTVNSTSDHTPDGCDPFPDDCTLREAINAANANAGPDLITFNINAGTDPGCNATSGVCTIQPLLLELPALTDDGTTIDGYSQPGATPASGVTPAALRIVLDGVSAPVAADGLAIWGSGGHLIKGLTIHRFDHGIFLYGGLATGIHVEGCHIGTDYLGIAPMPNNNDGIRFTLAANNNVIGGTSSAARNVISANNSDGIELEVASTDNVILGNYIGVDASGLLPLGNAGTGIYVRDNSSSNTIGGAVTGAGNVISSNGSDGINLNNSSTRGNVISGNIIGLGVDGTTDLGNAQYGIQVVNGADTNTIGGTTSEERNIISGNGASGVLIWTLNADDNLVIGNYIGTDSTGSVAIPNFEDGIRIMTGAKNNTIGGDSAVERNVISGNGSRGVYLGSGPNTVSGNYIGTDLPGSGAIPNVSGVVIQNAAGNIIGGMSAGEGNLISGNSFVGVNILGSSSTANEVVANVIGMNAAGTTAFGNGETGVALGSGANANTVGSGIAGSGNIIVGHTYGVLIMDSGTDSNVVIGNFIGTNAGGNLPFPNDYGVKIDYGAQQNEIGREGSGEGNLISGNAVKGILITGEGTDTNIVCGNIIGLDATGGVPLSNLGSGVEIANGPESTVLGGSSGCRNIISGNNGDGVYIHGLNTIGNIVSGNIIGLNAGGTVDRGNGQNGVYITASNITVGGENVGARNIISGNNQEGILIEWSVADANRVIGNYIGTNESGLGGVGNTYNGIKIFGGPTNTEIGGDTAAGGNLISGNGNSGVRVDGSATTGTIVSGNAIGVNATRMASLANAHNGITVTNGAHNTVIGGDTPAERNILSGNTFRGISLVGPGTNYNTVKGNYIGTDGTGLGALGNGSHGVLAVDGANLNTIGPDNLIAFNVDDGVSVESALVVTITQNSIHTNGGLGIDLVGSANNSMVAPTITQTSVGSIIIEGLSGHPDATVEVFSNPDNPGEGKTYLGSAPTIAGGFSLTVPRFSDSYLTATATDPSGNTSEFSATFISSVTCVFLPLIMR